MSELQMRKGMLLAAMAALGALAVVLPGVAGSETSPTVTAMNGPGLAHSWSPPNASVGEGGSVTFSNPTAVPHGVEWIGTPATPVCSGVPVGTSEAASGTKWSGNCTFTRPGTYTFYCTVHGAGMSGTITVTGASAGGPPGTTTTTTTTPPPSAPGSPGSPGTGSGAGDGEPGSSSTGTSPASEQASPFAGGAASAVKLEQVQRGSAVRGSVTVSSAAAGGGLEVDLLAKKASLASTGGHARSVRVGSFERGSLRAGTVHFTVALSAKARAALRRAGRLALTVRIELTPRGGQAAALARSVILRRAAPR